MGSGGLRGLQILRSGAHHARGRFDSYAFPPLLAALIAGTLAVLAAPAGAQAVAAAPARDSVAAAALDSVAVAPEPALAPVDSARLAPPASRIIEIADPGSPAARRARRDSTRAARQGTFDQPRFVMLRSLLVPGWGQLHNRAWLKALLVSGGEAVLISNVVQDGRRLKDLDAQVAAARAARDLEAENSAVERYNARLDHYVGRQWLLGGLLVYSLVDAYVDAHFVNFKFEFDHDAALPSGVRLGMEKHF